MNPQVPNEETGITHPIGSDSTSSVEGRVRPHRRRRDFSPSRTNWDGRQNRGYANYVGAMVQRFGRSGHLEPNDSWSRPSMTGSESMSTPSMISEDEARIMKRLRGTGFSSRRSELECFEFVPSGEFNLCRISRADILHEAREIAAVRFDLDARVRVSSRNWKSQTLVKGDRALRKYLGNSLMPRDIRQVDPAFSAKPALWVRHNAIIVSLESVRAIIFYHKLYLFDPKNPVVERAAKVLSSRLAASAYEPFEFRAMEGIFVHICMTLEVDFISIDPGIRKLLSEFPHRLTAEMLEALRLSEQKLKSFNSRASQVQHVMTEILEEDEDMANMYLTEIHKNPRVARNPLDHDFVEVLFESYLQVVDDLAGKGQLLIEMINDSENLIEIHLDTVQNKLLLVDLIVTLMTTIVTFGSMW
eukprot:CAMPEP_0184679160 /NCGR_PEP_ID=MMETSP0312-20130426/1985_1 /TAXON_ID=31354 /ORGANISM="Compsopogon coeruleus, Strain SAG 36.94" /LENGTH=415 /DNA_ID=CAMNT_0027128429 /DNA_START=434 /DNA_END=1678 /DNA_ORIENTATION=-